MAAGAAGKRFAHSKKARQRSSRGSDDFAFVQVPVSTAPGTTRRSCFCTSPACLGPLFVGIGATCQRALPIHFERSF